jgi:AcrR family transcriptional regulator
MKQRARRDEDKAERVGAILAAARELWEQSRARDFTVGAVAGRAGIVKGTVYIYFPTKEHLLLAVFECLLDEYVDEVNGALEKRRGRWSAEGVAGAIAAPLRKYHALLRLLPIVGSLNAKEAAAIASRCQTETVLLLGSRMPALRHDDALSFLIRAYALLTGFAAMAFPDLEREFRESLTALLHGMEKRK